MSSNMPKEHVSEVSVRIQKGQDDCGLTCLAMIADYFAISQIKKRVLNLAICRGEGVTIGAIIAMANSMGLHTSTRKVALNDITQLLKPSILYWRNNHFVVLANTHRNGVVIHDPESGRQLISWRKAKKNYSGVCIEFSQRKALLPKGAVSFDSYQNGFMCLS